MNRIHFSDNLPVLQGLKSASVDLIYIDPPFNTGATQKPLGVLRRIVTASSDPGDLVLDFFAGSGTTGAACLALGRRFMLVDNNQQALEVMARRFRGVTDIEWVGFDPAPFESADGQASLLAAGLSAEDA